MVELDLGADRVADLVAILDGEARGLLEQDDARLLIGLPRFLGLLTSEPRLAAALSGLRAAVHAREAEFNQHDAKLLREIRSLWTDGSHLFEKAEEAARAKGQESAFHTLGRRTQTFESALDEQPVAKFPSDDEIGQDPSRSGGLLRLLHHQHNWIPDQGEKERVGRAVRRLLEQHDYEYRRFWLDGRNLAGLAFARLRYRADSLNPPPGPQDDNADDVRAGAQQVKSLVQAVFDPASASDADQADLKAAAESIRRDARFLHRALRTELLLAPISKPTPAPRTRRPRS